MSNYRKVTKHFVIVYTETNQFSKSIWIGFAHFACVSEFHERLFKILGTDFSPYSIDDDFDKIEEQFCMRFVGKLT